VEGPALGTGRRGLPIAMYLGAHFPLDVVAGAGIGMLIGSVLNLVFGVRSVRTKTPSANRFQ
jgi:hypothetical protein